MFTTPSVTRRRLSACSGDQGHLAMWPLLPERRRGGRDQLTLRSGNYVSESAWSDSGGGPAR